MDTDLPGFADPTQQSDDENDLSKKNVKKGGGFQAMGLSFPILKGITKRGYKIPTPIQRKTIPLVLEGRDVVAMARTGSGKTACFLIPMFEKLKIRCAKSGARALILSPTRELALQTLKFIKELGKFMGLKAAVILGGDSMEDQFSAIHGSPDIVVATPGRFLHVCVEMELKLSSVEYVVFDEADRLFEMGLGEQLTDIVHRLPDSRQTLLFSATLPKVLVDFAKAGLCDPVLIRLDVDSKLPNELQLRFITVRPEEKVAALLVLLKSYIEAGQQTLVFVATKHHVEYLHSILDQAGVSNTYIYSNLDPAARKINAAKFSGGKAQVLVVTDVAARGIDIPHLDNVINFHFPAKSKLFVHRVGRCARAGRSGVAFSLISPDEYAYLLDLHLFLGRPINIVTVSEPSQDLNAIGRIPQDLVEEQLDVLITWHENHHDLKSMRKVCENGYSQYIRSRPAASNDSNRRAKTLALNAAGIHPIFQQHSDSIKKESMLEQMKNYRPQGTIFEINTKRSSGDNSIMKRKRAIHENQILSHHKKIEQLQEKPDEITITLTSSNTEQIEDTFKKIVVPKKRKLDDLYKKKIKKRKVEKDENYIPYKAPDSHTEQGLAVNSFHQEASRVQMDLIGDSRETQQNSKQLKRWDRKKKKMVTVNQDEKSKKILTESGVWIPATYKSNRYSEWKDKMKLAENDDSDQDDVEKKPKNLNNGVPKTHWMKHNRKIQEKARKSELKTSEQILKARLQKEKRQRRNGRRPKKQKSK